MAADSNGTFSARLRFPSAVDAAVVAKLILPVALSFVLVGLVVLALVF